MDPDPSISDIGLQLVTDEFNFLTGGSDVKPIDISGELPRHSNSEYRYPTRSTSVLDRIVIHCTDRDWSPHQIAKYDITPYWIVNGKKIYNHISKKGCPAITYHDLISPEGKVYHTLPYTEASWHAGGYNSKSIGVALMYQVKNEPEDKMLKALWRWVAKLGLSYGIGPNRVFGHRELKGTGWFFLNGHKRLRKSCPGLKVDLDLIRTNVTKYMQCIFTFKGLYRDKIDGVFGPKSWAAFVEYLKGK